MFDWIKRKRYREETATLAVLLCPDERSEAGGQRLKDWVGKALIALGGDVIDKGFASGRTPEQSALGVVGALIASSVKETEPAEQRTIRLELEDNAGDVTHPLSVWAIVVMDTALKWETASKVKRADIDGLKETVLASIPSLTPSQRAAYKAGQEAGKAINAAVEDYLSRRLPELSDRLLQVFRGQLKTIHDDPGVDPKVVARIEYDIFIENTKDYPAKLKQDVENGLGKWLDVAKEVGVGEIVEQQIEKRIAEASAKLREDAVVVLAEVVAPLFAAEAACSPE